MGWFQFSTLFCNNPPSLPRVRLSSQVSLVSLCLSVPACCPLCPWVGAWCPLSSRSSTCCFSSLISWNLHLLPSFDSSLSLLATLIFLKEQELENSHAGGAAQHPRVIPPQRARLFAYFTTVFNGLCSQRPFDVERILDRKAPDMNPSLKSSPWVVY